MTLGVMLSSMSLYFAFRPSFPGFSILAKESYWYSALIGSFYCAAGLSAILYPGTDWKDPGIEVGGAQKFLFSGVVAAMWVGYGLEVARMGQRKGKGA